MPVLLSAQRLCAALCVARSQSRLISHFMQCARLLVAGPASWWHPGKHEGKRPHSVIVVVVLQVGLIRRAFEYVDDTVWLHGVMSKMRFTVVYPMDGDCSGSSSGGGSSTTGSGGQGSSSRGGGSAGEAGRSSGDSANSTGSSSSQGASSSQAATSGPSYARRWSEAVETGVDRLILASSHVALVSARLLPSPGWLASLMTAGARAHVGAVHAKVLQQDGSIAHFGYDFRRCYVQEVSGRAAGCM